MRAHTLPLLMIAGVVGLVVLSTSTYCRYLTCASDTQEYPEPATLDEDLPLANAALVDAELAKCPTGVRELDQQGKVIALASYPGSGNTWVRHLIQQGTGYCTGAYYNDTSLYEQFPCEDRMDASVIAVKTHFPCQDCWWFTRPNGKIWSVPRDKSGVIPDASGSLFILRNPFDVILAEFNRQMGGKNHTGIAPRELFEQKVWADNVSFRAKSWVTHAKYYMNKLRTPKVDNAFLDGNKRPVFVVVYERLKSGSKSEYFRLFDGLNKLHTGDQVDLPDPDFATKCAFRSIEGAFVRKPKERFNPYSAAQVAHVCKVVRPFWRSDLWGNCMEGKLAWQRERTPARGTSHQT